MTLAPALPGSAADRWGVLPTDPAVNVQSAIGNLSRLILVTV